MRGVNSRLVGAARSGRWSSGIGGGSPRRSIAIGEGEELSFFGQIVSGSGGRIERFLALFERMRLSTGSDD